jgi:hypothetical protein
MRILTPLATIQPAKQFSPRHKDFVIPYITEPLASWRKVSVRETKTRVDWAQEIQTLLDVDYPQAGKVILICDNLNTHKIASLYEAFPPAEAKRLRDRLEIHCTPKRGSWLNVAKIELSLLTRQCLQRRLNDIQTVRQEAKAWYQTRNEKRKSVDWQFRCEDARIKLKRLYPQSPILQSDLDKLRSISDNGKCKVKSLRPFTQLDEQTYRSGKLRRHFGVFLQCVASVFPVFGPKKTACPVYSQALTGGPTTLKP